MEINLRKVEEAHAVFNELRTLRDEIDSGEHSELVPNGAEAVHSLDVVLDLLETIYKA